MERLTTFDNVNKCYVMKPDVQQGLHIQKLGRLEDLEERGAEIGPEPAEWEESEDGFPKCGACGHEIHVFGCNKAVVTPYCPWCGRKMKYLMIVEE